MAVDRQRDETSPTSSADDPPGALSRRRILVGAAGVGALGVASSVLVGCGGSNDSGAGPSSGTPTETSGATGPLATTDEVPVRGGLVLKDQKIVITQPAAGDFKAFTAVCTHMGCLVRTVADNVITCPCHGSQYDAATGEVVKDPAPRALAPIGITVTGTAINLS